MEAIKQWFQDWSEACEYAHECAPDFASLPIGDGEPITALLGFGLGCFLIWAWNERQIARRNLGGAGVTTGVDTGELNTLLARMKEIPRAARKLAA